MSVISIVFQIFELAATVRGISSGFAVVTAGSTHIPEPQGKCIVVCSLLCLLVDIHITQCRKYTNQILTYFYLSKKNFLNFTTFCDDPR